MLTENSSQVRIRTDLLDQKDTDIRVRVYSVGNQKDLDSSIKAIKRIAQNVRDEITCAHISSSSKKDRTAMKRID